MYYLRHVTNLLPLAEKVSYRARVINRIHAIFNFTVGQVGKTGIRSSQERVNIHIAIIMGLNMDNIHIPSIASGPTTGHASTKTLEQGQLSLLELHSEKQRIEEEISALSRVLESVCFRLPHWAVYARRLILLHVNSMGLT